MKPEDSFKYLKDFSSEENAQNRSHEIAQSQGYNTRRTYWFSWVKHPDLDNWALVITDGEESKLTEEEQLLLLTRLQAENAGWFPDLPA